MNVLTDIADAVAAALNAAVAASAFPAGVNFTAVRAHLPEKDVSGYQNLTVIVAVKGYEKEVLSRRDAQWTVDIDVGTVQHVADKTNATLDPLVLIVQTMASKTVLEKALSANGGRAEWIRTSSQPHFDRDRLSTKNLFFNLTTYTYVTVRPR